VNGIYYSSVARTKTRPRERRREANVARILDVAMGAIVEGGFRSFSMNKLADACDYTPGALYRYFASKDALVSALVQRVLVDVGHTLRAGVEALPEDRPLARIFALVDSYRRFSMEEPNRFALIASSFTEPERVVASGEAAGEVIRAMVDTMAPLADALDAAQRLGHLSPGSVVERGLVVLASTQGVLQMHKQARVAPTLVDVEHLSSVTLVALLVGWGAEPARVDAARRTALEDREHTGDPPR